MPASTPAAIPASSITMRRRSPTARRSSRPRDQSRRRRSRRSCRCAITAMIEDCTRILVRLSGERKRSVSSAVTAHSTISEMSGIWPARFTRNVGFGHVTRRSPCAASARRSVGAIERGGDPSPAARPARCRTAAPARRDRWNDRRSRRRHRSRAAKSRISAWICALAATSMPWVGSSSSSTATRARQPFRQDHLLLIAAGERARREPRLRAGGYRAAPSARRRCGRPPCGRASRARESASRLGSRMLSRTDWFITRPSMRSPGTMPMPAAMASAGCLNRRLRLRTSRRSRPGGAEQAAQHPVGAAAEQAGEADDLAGAQAQHVRAVRCRGEQHIARSRPAAAGTASLGSGRSWRRRDRRPRNRRACAPPSTRPSRSTVQRSAIATTSSSRWEI